MRDWKGKRYWLVGAGEGLGEALARKLSAAGAEVIVSARTVERIEAVARSLPGPARAVAVDVADSASVRAAAAEVGEIDGVVFLAGVYWPMTAQAWDADKAEAMCDVNFTGCVRVVGAVLPAMVARGRGHVVLTGSLSAFRGLPGAIGYSASKAGVLSLAESMQCDLRGSGILVQVSNPGFIKTRLTDKNDFSMPFLMEADEAADHMFRQMSGTRFKVSFPMVFSWLFRLSQLMPDTLYFRIFRAR